MLHILFIDVATYQLLVFRLKYLRHNKNTAHDQGEVLNLYFW